MSLPVAPRLLFRLWRPEDLEPLRALLQDAEVTRYLFGRTATDGEIVAVYSRRLAQFERYGFGLWALELLAEPGRFIGWAGLQFADKFHGLADEIEVGWTLARDAWGLGLATEAGAASLDYGFDVLGRERIVALHAPGNHRSERVMVKLGMQPAGETEHETAGRTIVRDVTRDTWRVHRKSLSIEGVLRESSARGSDQALR